MSPLEALRAARRHGVEVIAAHGALHLHARMEPPSWVWRALGEHKAAIIDLLRPDDSGWTAEDWAVFCEERAAILEYEHGVARLEAEIRAHEQTEAERARRRAGRSTAADPARAISSP